MSFLKLDHELQITRIQDVSHIIWTQQATETVCMIKLEAITLKKYVFVEVSTKWNMRHMYAIQSTPKLHTNSKCNLLLTLIVTIICYYCMATTFRNCCTQL
jgi:hypothetical protein